MGFWWGVRVYLRRTSQALHAPGDPSPRLCGSTSPPSRGARSLECLYPCSRISLGVFWGPTPALTGHRLIHMWRWHVARGAGLAGPLLLRASLPLFCSGAAAASSGWTSRPQEGRGHFGGRRGGERARSGEKPGWQTAPAHPGLGPGAGRGGVYAVGGSRAIPRAPPHPECPRMVVGCGWAWGPRRDRWRLQGLHRPGQETSVRAVSSAALSGRVSLGVCLYSSPPRPAPPARCNRCPHASTHPCLDTKMHVRLA